MINHSILCLAMSLAISMSALAGPDYVQAFDKIWEIGKQEIYPLEKSQRFTEAKRLELRRVAERASDFEELAQALNPFLLSLGVSHTYFYIDSYK
jgi:hypothetical protein